MRSLDEVLDFWSEHGTRHIISREQVKKFVQQHVEYHTIIVLEDKVGINALVRWNEDGNIGHILDCVVRRDKRSYKFLRQLMQLGFSKRPHIDTLIWERETKYPKRSQITFRRK